MGETQIAVGNEPRLTQILQMLTDLEDRTKEIEHELISFNVNLFGLSDVKEAVSQQPLDPDENNIISSILRGAQRITETVHNLSIDVSKMSRELPQEGGKR